MDPMGIASASMAVSETQIQQSYAIAMTRKTMETQEIMAKEILEMLPQVPKGQYIDVYA